MFMLFMVALLLVPGAALLPLALLLSVPVAVLLGFGAWSDYSQAVPPDDALYLSPVFWTIEAVCVLVLLYLIAIAVDNS